MKYITAILELLNILKKICDSIAEYVAKQKRVNEVKKVEELKVEVKENIKKGDIDKINERLKF